jgi:tetratricopeptide (TPR) repeat protein
MSPLASLVVSTALVSSTVSPRQEAQDPYTRVQQAHAALEAGQYQRVLAIVDDLLAEYPDSPSSHLLRGMALDELGRLDDAEKSYEAALKSAPDEPQILARFGMHLIRRGAWKRAVAPLERSARAAPDPANLFYLAQAYFQTDEKAEALETLERAIALQPDNPTMRLKLGEYQAHGKKYSNALETLLRAQELDPKLPGLDLALGIVYLRLLEVESARAALQRAAQREPDSPAVLSMLAEACSKARDHAAARQHYERLLELGEDDPRTHLGLGAALVGLGENEAAIPELAKAIELDPRLEQAHFHLARAYRACGRDQEAAEALQVFRALKANPFTRIEDRSELERKLWKQAQELVEAGKEDEALRLLTREGDTSGNQPQFLVGALYYWLGRYDDAERLLAQAKQIAPAAPNLRTYLGLTHLARGRLDEAEAMITKELEENPREALALMAFGQLCFHKRSFGDAALYLQESRIVDPRVLLMLCEAQLELGQRNQALDTMDLIETLAAGGTTRDAAALAKMERLRQRYGLGPAVEPAASPRHPEGT